MDMRCPVKVDGKPCDRRLTKQEVEDQKLGRIVVYVCEQGHRALFTSVSEEPAQSKQNPVS
jgi:hypothetical protein